MEEAVSNSETKHIAILATKGAVESSEIDDFIGSRNLPDKVVIHKVNASDLVNLVEPGTFQSDQKKTKEVIRFVIDKVIENDKTIDVMTLSSTHLPFLAKYLNAIYPNILFLDPAEIIGKEVRMFLKEKKLLSLDKGRLEVFTTVDKQGKLKPDDLSSILKNLGLNTRIQIIKL